MNIKTLGDFRKATANLEDDFILEVDLFNRIPDEQLKNMSYPYPWDREEVTFQFNDVGYSDRKACFGVYKITPLQKYINNAKQPPLAAIE